MDIELKSTIRHKGKTSDEEPNHYTTFGIYNDIDWKGKGRYFVTIGVKEGDTVATADIPLDDLRKLVLLFDDMQE